MRWNGDYVLLEILSQWEHYPRTPSLPNFYLCTCKVWSCYVQGFRRKCICKKHIIKPWPYVKVTWSIALYIMWPVYLQNLKLLWPMVKEMHYQEITLFDLDPKVKGVLTPRSRGSRSHKMFPSTPDFMWPMHEQNLMLLHPLVKEKMHLQENALFDLGLGLSVTQNVAQYAGHHVTYAPAKFDIATSHS